MQVDEDIYDRQKRIDKWDQKCITNSVCLVVGAGALGNEVIKNIIQLGVEKIYVVDFDYVVYANLNRCVLLRESDARSKTSKVYAIARRAKEINSSVNVIPLEMRVEEMDPEIYDKCDVVFSCLDNLAARLHVNAHAYSKGKPLIDGGMDGFFGKVQVVLPPHTSCLECTLTTEDYRKMWERFSCDLEEISFTEKKIPSIPTTTAIVSAVEVQEFIKIAHKKNGINLGEPIGGKLWLYNGITMKTELLNVDKRADCNVCRKIYAK